MMTYQRRQNRASRPSYVVLMLSVVLILGVCGFSVGCGSEDVVDTTSPADTAEVKSYTDPIYGFSFDYPADWKLDEDSGAEIEGGINAAKGVSVFDPQGASNGRYFLNVFQVSVYELAMTIDDSVLPDVKPQLESAIAGVASQDESWETLEAMSAAEAGGLNGFKTTVTHALDGEMVKSTLYFLFDGSIEYELMLQAGVEDWETAQADLGAVLASFRPGVSTDATDTNTR